MRTVSQPPCGSTTPVRQGCEFPTTNEHHLFRTRLVVRLTTRSRLDPEPMLSSVANSLTLPCRRYDVLPTFTLCFFGINSSSSQHIMVWSCTVHTWARWEFQPYSAHRRCQLLVYGRNTRRFLHFRLGCHNSPIATGHRAWIGRASRQCTFCSVGALGDGIWSLSVHLWLRCGHYADLFTATTDTMPSLEEKFFLQSDHLRIFTMSYTRACVS